MFNATIFPFCVLEPFLPTLDATVIWISASTQSYDSHWWFMVNQPTPFVSNCWSVSTSPSLIRFRSTSELFPRPCSAHMSGNSSLLPKLASVCFLGLPRFLFTVVLSELFPIPRSAHMSGNSLLAYVCSLGLPRFFLYGCTFSETMLCCHDRQLYFRLFRHSMRPRTSSHFHAIRANDDDRRVRVR